MPFDRFFRYPSPEVYLNKTFKNIFYSFFAVFFSKFIGAVSTFLIAKLLVPADYGVWLTLLLIYSYTPILCLGTMETLVKQYPYHIGRKEFEKALRIESGVLSSLILASIAACIMGICLPLFLKTSFLPSRILFHGMVAASALGFLSSFYYFRFTARQEFKVVGQIDILRTTITLACVAIGAKFAGLGGAVIGFLVTELVVFWVSMAWNDKAFGSTKIKFDFNYFWELVKIGFPISVIWWFYMLELSVNRIISMELLGKEATGFLGIGQALVSLLVLIPMVVGRVLYPRINEEVGKKSKPERMARLVIDPSRTLSILLAFCIGVMIVGAPVVYRKILPHYAPGLFCAQILLLGAFFICLIRNSLNYLVAINKQKTVILYVSIGLLVNVILCIALAKAGFSIEGIAMATDISLCILSTGVLYTTFANMKYSAKGFTAQTLSLYLPLGILAALLIPVWLKVPSFMSGDYLATAINEVLFAASFSFLVFFLPPLKGWSRRIVASVNNNILRGAVRQEKAR
jgi:O-antigen/teichoic acid export membrane protein